MRRVNNVGSGETVGFRGKRIVTRRTKKNRLDSANREETLKAPSTFCFAVVLYRRDVGAYALLKQKYPDRSSQEILNAMKGSLNRIDDVVIKDLPIVDLEYADITLDSGEVIVSPDSGSAEQKVTVDTFNGFIAIFTRGYEGKRMTAKVAGKWLVVNPIENYKNFDYSRTTRNTGAGYQINVDVYIDGVLKESTQVLTR